MSSPTNSDDGNGDERRGVAATMINSVLTPTPRSDQRWLVAMAALHSLAASASGRNRLRDNKDTHLEECNLAKVTLTIEADIDQAMVIIQRMAGKDIASPTTGRANLAALPPPPQSEAPALETAAVAPRKSTPMPVVEWKIA